MNKVKIQKLIYVLCLILIVCFVYSNMHENTWLTEKWEGYAHRLSIGFPCQSIHYTTLQPIQGNLHEADTDTNIWKKGISFNFFFLIIDFYVLTSLFLVLYFAVSWQHLILLFKASTCGLIAGGLLWSMVAIEWFLSIQLKYWIFLSILFLVLFIILPLMTYIISWRFRKPKTVIFLTSAIIVLFLASGAHRLDDLFIDPYIKPKITDFIGAAILFVIISTECLIIHIIKNKSQDRFR